MKLISSNQRLTNTLSRLLHEHDHTCIAVAWASSGNDVFELLKKRADRIHKVIIGTHFYQTHPDVLDVFLASPKVRFMLQPSGVFHPKLYVFWSNQKWDVLIGSANLTTGALSTNSEAMVHISSSAGGKASLKDDLISLVEKYWCTAQTVDKRTAAAYREIWKKRRPEIQRLSGQYGAAPSKKAPVSSSIMSMSWKQYYAELLSGRSDWLRGRLQLLAFAKAAFLQHARFSMMDTPTRKAIAGLPTKHELESGWFGGMRGSGIYHSAVNNNVPFLSAALDCIPLSGLVTKQDYKAYISEFVRAFPSGGHGVGIASRLLAMKRPDQFICLDAKNRRRLCKDFGIVQSGMNYDRYWDEIVQRVMDSPWWNEGRPRSVGAKSLWEGRAAMLDAIFYEG